MTFLSLQNIVDYGSPQLPILLKPVNRRDLVFRRLLGFELKFVFPLDWLHYRGE